MMRLGVRQRCFFLVLLVFSCTQLTCNASTVSEIFQHSDLDALQAVWGAWNASTPEPESNLAGWNSSQYYPCIQEITPNAAPNWRGVQCLMGVNCVETDTTTGDWSCSALIVGLSLEKASIVGTLPPEIGNISTLTTLELTENPLLTGTLPATLGNTNLHTLDLHDNGFFGEIPDFGNFKWPLILDLSGNAFTGSFPLPQIRSMVLLQKLSLGRNDFYGEIPELALQNMTQLTELDLSNNNFSGRPPTLSIRNLQTLDLSSNNFNGPLPNLTMLKNLQTLYLDNNFIYGTLNITQLLALGLLSMKSPHTTPSSGLLTVLSLRNNSISNVVCDDHTIDNIATIFRLEGNPYCAFNDGSIFYHQACNPVQILKYDKRKVVIIATVTSAISVLLMITLAATLYRHYKYKEYSQVLMQKKFEEFEVKPTIFPYNQLRTATRDFHVDMKLGQGAFGAVYKGIFPNGNVVAVKQLFAKTTQGIDEFLNEVVLLTGMKHRNLVNLKGCCIREQQRLLVYEYVDNYDVEKVLLAGPNKTVLSWPVRLKICLGVARGLHYLHALAHPRIIHRDIKASNVLLAKNYDTKIADFGLASLFPDEESYIMTMHVAGTKGYLAPEYASFGQLSDKVDVFSFGVLCLEVVSGRRNIDETLPPGEMYLSKWAWELLQRDSLVELVDRTMSLQDEEKLEVHRLINIALLCIQNEAEQRPSMERVVAMLQGDSQSEAVVPKPGNEEQYLESIRLFDVGKSSLAAVKEEVNHR